MKRERLRLVCVRGRAMETLGVLVPLVLLALLAPLVGATTDLGGVIRDKVVLSLDGSPYVVREDLLVEEKGTLVLHSGVEMRFLPQVGITVRGVLQAKGEEGARILMTSSVEPTRMESLPSIRLVDGPSPLVGRLQILYKSKWRSVCTNSRNWTSADLQTTCRELGFTGGEFFHWYDHYNLTRQMLYEKPNCSGSEVSLQQCDWKTRQMGSGVCDFHPNLGLSCQPFHAQNLATQNWRGLRFENALSYLNTQQDNLKFTMSYSSLEHVDIRYAGAGKAFNATSAIETVGVPPLMDFVKVEHSAYNGLNISSPIAAVSIQNSNIVSNRGYGVYVNSSFGMVHLSRCNISRNGADGVKYVYHDRILDRRGPGSTYLDYCSSPSTAWATYPLLYVTFGESHCGKSFSTSFGYVITVHLVYMYTGDDGGGGAQIVVRDGKDNWGPILATVDIRNDTWSQSVVSTGNALYLEYLPAYRKKSVVFMALSTGPFKDYDLNVSSSFVADNNGPGVSTYNIRNMVHVHQSVLTTNSYAAGLYVVDGAGDVNVTHSQIGFNEGDGINITYSGGSRNVSWSTLSSNTGRGMSVWFNETSNKIPVIQETIVAYSEISRNERMGLLVGNCCREGMVNVSGNVFTESKDVAVKIEACWRKSLPGQEAKNKTNIQIGNNQFKSNSKIAIQIEPPANMDGKIEYNQFSYNNLGCILIKGKDLEELEDLPVDIEVSNNYFWSNRGVFVANLGMSQYSIVQKLLFTFNFVRDSEIEEPFPTLNPRSRVAAPVVVSSPNTIIFRNIIDNPKSRYEVGSHLCDQSYEINATYNWLGSKEEHDVYYRLFDRKDRYDLAQVNYFPFLLKSSDPHTHTVKQNREFTPDFCIDRKDGTFEVGGEVTGTQELIKTATYLVKRDINVRPGGKLTIVGGATLKFESSLGLMVAGELDANGDDLTDKYRVTFTLADFGRENLTDVPVKLVGGRSAKEGRLQVIVGNQWGTVCKYGFGVEDAALVCHQMGLVLNPGDWMLQRSEVPAAGTNEKVLLSNIECTDYDHDITQCKAENEDDFENSCGHDNDVGMRCYDPSWAGIRLGMTAIKSTLQNVRVELAGLLDYSTNTFKPAIQMDFSRHFLQSLQVSDNIHDGLGVIYSDLYIPDNVNHVRKSTFSRNLGNGISMRQLGLKLEDCTVEHNKGSGVMHNPFISRQDQRQMAGWIAATRDGEWMNNLIFIPSHKQNIELQDGKSKFLVTERMNTSIVKKYNISTSPQSNIIGIQLLNPIYNDSSEEITIYDAPFDTQLFPWELEVWKVKQDQVTFPTASSAFGITLEYHSGGNSRGQTIIMLTSRKKDDDWKKAHWLHGPVPKLQLKNTHIKYNTKGITSYHYNRYLSDLGDHYLRKANETIEVFDSEVSYNDEEAVYFYAPFRDIYSSNMSENTFMMNRSLITDNGKGIVQYSRDLRSSNNLFHWILQDNTFDRNSAGGFDVALPYVWQYDDNHTHSVFLANNTFKSTQQFRFNVDGHFAALDMYNNVFDSNFCKEGLILIQGMEKEMKVFGNRIENNVGNYMVEFSANSQSEIMGEVLAYFAHNLVQKNRYTTPSVNMSHYQPASYVIGLRGIQKVNVTNNRFGTNTLDFEFLAGIRTARIDNYVNVHDNWWGTTDPNEIKEKIFDFDDWNCFAIANYRPFFLEDTYNAAISSGIEPLPPMNVDNLGGRLFESLTIYKRDKPYVIKSDLTIMPDATLTISPGVTLEFYPSVGILVLGTLFAKGNAHEIITMRPLKKKEATQYRVGRNAWRYDVQQQDVRLCIEGKCEEGASEGFLEYFNKTTLQWVPLCDQRFEDRNAQVVCRQLGFDSMNVFVDFGKRIEFQSNSLSRVRFWPEPYQCKGNELTLDDCDVRLNGQLYGHESTCDWEDNFVFIHCGERNLDASLEYWGGVRFSVPEFEQNFYEHRMQNARASRQDDQQESIIEYVLMVGAGILHNEKSPSVQAIRKSPIIRNVNITNAASHAVNLIAFPHSIKMLYNRFENNLGLGVSGLSITGEAGDGDQSSFMPLRNVHIPYNLFGLVDACDTSKEILVEERILMYFKYDNTPVDCVKIFYSAFGSKALGFRLLQLNLYNSTGKPWPPDTITLYDGDLYNYTAHKIDNITMEPANKNKFYRTYTPSLSVKVHATGANESHGFIAEVLTLPASPSNLDRDIQFNLSFSVVKHNEKGAVFYGSAGEINPIVTMDRNQFDVNCQKLYGNFSTCDAAVAMDIQNTPHIMFKNNLVRNNQGGLYVMADSGGSATSLQAFVRNNLFTGNSNRETVHMEGKRSSPYQKVIMYKNYFTKSNATYHDMMVLKQIVSNLTSNYFHTNIGKHIIEVSGFNNVRLPVYQTCAHNNFWENFATDINIRGTVIAASAGQQYVDNVFVNPDNDYELVAGNKTFITYNPSWENWGGIVKAKNNWWGFNETLAVMGRVKDSSDDYRLMDVTMQPFLLNNRSLLSGKCNPGWTLVGETCFLYVGGPMNFKEARQFCRSDNASMPYVMSNYAAVTEFLRYQQEDFQYFDMVWVQNLDMIGECTVFVDGRVQAANCEFLLPSICETDPKVYIDPLAWTNDMVTVAALGVTLAAILIILLVLGCWFTKSRKRRVQRLERRNSIRASVRSLASTSGFSDMDYRRRITQQQKTPVVTPSSRLGDYNKMNGGSLESVEKSVSQFSSSIEDSHSYDIYEARNNTFSDIDDHLTAKEKNVDVEPENVLSKPSFDLTYQNQGFRDNSTFASREPSNRDHWGSKSSNITNGAAPVPQSFKPALVQVVPSSGSSNVYMNVPSEDGHPSREATLPLRGPGTGTGSSSSDTLQSQLLETLIDDPDPGSIPPRTAVSQPTLIPLPLPRQYPQRPQRQPLETDLDLGLPLPPRTNAPSRARSEVLETHFEAYPPRSQSPMETGFGRSKSQPLETAM